MDQSRIASHVSSGPINDVVVHLSPQLFILMWYVIMLLHIGCVVYYYHVIKLHLFLKHHDYASYMGNAFTHYFDAVIVTSGFFAGGHALAFCGPVLVSIWKRELTFDVSFINKRLKTEKSFNMPRMKVINMAKRALNAWFGPQGYLSIGSPHFNEIFVLREIVESVCQTYQAYRISSLISSVWVNRVFAIGIILNCWSSSIVNTLCSWRECRQTSPALTSESQTTDMANQSIRRVGYLIVDLIFNGFASIVIPIVIISGYVRDYHLGDNDFPFIFYYNDTWVIKAVAENSQLFVSSWVDFVSKEFPNISILMGLITLASAIRRHKVENSTKTLTSIQTSTDVNLPIKNVSHKHRIRWFNRISHTLLVIWGLFVLLLHVYATSVAVLHRIPGCLLEIRPWFSSQYNCVVIDLNCDRIMPNSDNIVDMDAILTPLATWSVQSVIISSCPQVVMPTRITHFNKLLVLKLYNSTIYEWGASAALERAKHPNIQFLFIIETNMSTLPEGLLAPDFPHSLQDIEISGTNLSSLPTNLHEIWGLVDEEASLHNYLDVFVFENIYGGLTEVPSTLADPYGLRTRVLSLCDSGMNEVPERFFWANSSVQWLEIASNPLVNLPDREPYCNLANLVVVFCETFNELPSWVNETTGNPLTLFLGGTPICESTDTPEPSREGDSMINIVCSIAPGATTELFFPRSYESRQRQIARFYY